MRTPTGLALPALVFLLGVVAVAGECLARCRDQDYPNVWLDKDGWSCMDYIASAQQGKEYNWCGSDGSGQACCFCGGGSGGDVCATGCNDVDGWQDSNGWTCADYVWSAENYCGFEDSSTACCYCKDASTTEVAGYCEDVAGWKDSEGSSCGDYRYMADVDGQNHCGHEDSAAACCFCGGGSSCKPCGPAQYFEACGDCRECSAAPACPLGQVRAGCGYGSVGVCMAPKTDKAVQSGVSGANGLRAPSMQIRALGLGLPLLLQAAFSGRA